MVGNERVMLVDQPRKNVSFPGLDLTYCDQYHSGSW